MPAQEGGEEWVLKSMEGFYGGNDVRGACRKSCTSLQRVLRRRTGIKMEGLEEKLLHHAEARYPRHFLKGREKVIYKELGGIFLLGPATGEPKKALPGGGRRKIWKNQLKKESTTE